MLSTSIFSYLLPLSLIQSSIPLSSRPVPSGRISLSLPLSLRNNNAPSLPSLLANALALPDWAPTGLNNEAMTVSGEEGGSWENKAVQTDSEVDEGVWYYGLAAEEELQQERELWRLLLRATSKNGEIPSFFRDLVEGHDFRKVRLLLSLSLRSSRLIIRCLLPRRSQDRNRNRAGLDIAMRTTIHLRKPLDPRRAPLVRALTLLTLSTASSSSSSWNPAQTVFDPSSNLDRFVLRSCTSL